MTATENIKVTAKQKYENAYAMVNRTINDLRVKYLEKLAKFEKFHQDMLKVSPDFELRKVEMTEYFNVYVDSFPVNKLEFKYYELDIMYTGVVPESVTRNYFKVDVSEHYINRRGSWRSSNEGYKVRAQINYDYGPYYKNGATVAKKIIESVNNLLLIDKRNNEVRDLNNRAYKELSKMFPYNLIETNRKSYNRNSETRDKYTIKNFNGSMVTVSYQYDKETETFSFNTESVVAPTTINLESLVKKLSMV